MMNAAPTVVPLWSSPAPHSLGLNPNDIPFLNVFLPENPTSATPAIIVFPGGGYGMLCTGYEGENLARWFQGRGVAAFVLHYRLPVNGYLHPVPLLDAQRALRLVRHQAAAWKIDPAKIGIMGFSAGGHLAATVDTAEQRSPYDLRLWQPALDCRHRAGLF